MSPGVEMDEGSNIQLLECTKMILSSRRAQSRPKEQNNTATESTAVFAIEFREWEDTIWKTKLAVLTNYLYCKELSFIVTIPFVIITVYHWTGCTDKCVGEILWKLSWIGSEIHVEKKYPLPFKTNGKDDNHMLQWREESISFVVFIFTYLQNTSFFGKTSEE